MKCEYYVFFFLINEWGKGAKCFMEWCEQKKNFLLWNLSKKKAVISAKSFNSLRDPHYLSLSWAIVIFWFVKTSLHHGYFAAFFNGVCADEMAFSLSQCTWQQIFYYCCFYWISFSALLAVVFLYVLLRCITPTKWAFIMQLVFCFFSREEKKKPLELNVSQYKRKYLHEVHIFTVVRCVRHGLKSAPAYSIFPVFVP